MIYNNRFNFNILAIRTILLQDCRCFSQPCFSFLLATSSRSLYDHGDVATQDNSRWLLNDDNDRTTLVVGGADEAEGSHLNY